MNGIRSDIAMPARPTLPKDNKGSWRNPRTMRHAAMIALGASALVIGTWFGVHALIRLPWRVVNEVTVAGCTYTSPDMIRERSEVPLGAPLFAVNTDSVIDRVKSVPWVADAEISRRLSGRFEIHITERTPVGMFWSGGFNMVDATGHSARVWDSSVPDVPIIANLSQDDSVRTLQLRAIGPPLGQIAGLPSLRPIVSEISLADENYVVLVLAPDGVPVWLPRTVGKDRLVSLASLATHHPDALRRARYVDGRFVGHLAVRN